MMCLVQSFQQQQQPVKEKSSKIRRLPFFRRRKKTASVGLPEGRDDNLLHPDNAKDIPGTLWHQDKPRLSGSAPSVTCASLERSLTPSTCRSRQKKFLRHFNVDPDEKVIDYYSCALVADILLQGHLYISKNYFAFYSNVFGYVTKLLIPTTSVVNVTKEKTAFILPNAVGVATADSRHVFSSLLSRDTTYRLMVHVWRTALIANTPDIIAAPETELDGSVCESSLSGSESVFDLKTTSKLQVPNLQELTEPAISPPVTSADVSGRPTVKVSTVLLVVATVLLIALFLSASILMYRVAQLQLNLSSQHPLGSLYEVKEVLETNLNHLYKVRQSLEALSVIIENNREKTTNKENVILLQNLKLSEHSHQPEVLHGSEDASS